MNRLRLILALCAITSTVGSATAAPVKKHAVPYTKGHAQMTGGNGLFGQTYTVVSTDGFGPINFTLVSAAYSVERVNMAPGNTYPPKNNEKLLVIHYRVKNPTPGDLYYSSRRLFQAVDPNNNTIPDAATSRRASEKEPIGTQIKPGQGIDDLFTYIVVPAQGAIPKLILQLGRAGSKDLVTRYALGTAPNIVKPIPAPYADPSDKSGATALAEVPAVIGKTYVAGYLDISLDSAMLVPGPLGRLTAPDGKQFLVATITFTNKAFDHDYFNGNIMPTLKTDDDKITEFQQLKAKHDEAFDGHMIDPGETATERCVLTVSKDAELKTLSLAESVNNTGGLSKAFVYDVSGIK